MRRQRVTAHASSLTASGLTVADGSQRDAAILVRLSRWTEASLTMQLTSGVGVFEHVSGQNVDTTSHCCDAINILSAIRQENVSFLSHTT